MTSGYDVSLELEKIEEQRPKLSESCFHNCRTWNDNPIAKKTAMEPSKPFDGKLHWFMLNVATDKKRPPQYDQRNKNKKPVNKSKSLWECKAQNSKTYIKYWEYYSFRSRKGANFLYLIPTVTSYCKVLFLIL